MSHYGRTELERRSDYAASKRFEAEVAEHLPGFVDDRTDDTNALDFYIPEFTMFVEVKEKRQRYGKRWHLLHGVAEPNLFILDELSFRKAVACAEEYGAEALFVIRDVPGGNRLFLASTDELMLVDRVRVNRIGPTGHAKGKWILDLSHLFEVPSMDDLWFALKAHCSDSDMKWEASECLSFKEIPRA